MEQQIERFLEQVATSSPGLGSVWLIGSRANGTATESSDWDFIAFGTEATLKYLRAATQLHRAKTDFLVVTNGEDFQVCMGREGQVWLSLRVELDRALQRRGQVHAIKKGRR